MISIDFQIWIASGCSWY